MSTKTAPKGKTQFPVHIGPRLYSTRSWTADGVVYQQDVKAGTCTCKAGENGRACKHLENAKFAELFRCIGIARTLPSFKLEAAIAAHQDPEDPCVLDACRWVLYQREIGQDTEPAIESSGDRAAQGQPTPAEARIHA